MQFDFVISQEHTTAFAAMMNNSESVNLMNGFVNDLFGAATEVLKEAKVCSSTPYYIYLFVLLYCSSIFMYLGSL